MQRSAQYSVLSRHVLTERRLSSAAVASSSASAESTTLRRLGAALFSGLCGTTACLCGWQVKRYGDKVQMVEDRKTALQAAPRPLREVYPDMYRDLQIAMVERLTGLDRPLRVSSVASLDEAQVCITYSKGWDEIGLTHELVKLQQRAYRARGFGDFWQHMLVAEGAIDIAVDAVGVMPYDLAAVMIVVEEAGGTFTDRHGVRTFESDTAISSNGILHVETASLGA